MLLKTIAITSHALQEVVARDVYLVIIDHVVSENVQMVNQVAYLTVLISLTQAIADNSLWQPLARLTLQDEATCRKLEQIISLAVFADNG